MKGDLTDASQTAPKKYTSPDGTIRFIKYGKLHNTEEAAMIDPDGNEFYFINGIEYDLKGFKRTKRDRIGLPWSKSGVGK